MTAFWFALKDYRRHSKKGERHKYPYSINTQITVDQVFPRRKEQYNYNRSRLTELSKVPGAMNKRVGEL